MRKILSVAVAAVIVCVSFSMVSVNQTAEDITGPFVVRNDGYMTRVPNLDQGCEDGISSYTVSPPYFYAQTFTPSMTGDLSIVSVQISMTVIITMPVRCEIRTATGGVPDGSAEILTYEVDTFTLSPTPTWCDVTFSLPATVTNSVTYAIVVYTSGIIWSWGGIYAGGDGYESMDSGESWSTLGGGDFNFRTYVDVEQGASVRKVAWHPSGNFALGVNGIDSAVWEYYRDLGSWSVAIVDFGLVFNDIFFDAYSDRFYAVGNDGGAPLHPRAVEINPYAQPMTWTPLGGPAGLEGNFLGGCSASEGTGPFLFLAVGSYSSYALACWYHSSLGWVNADGGDMATSDGHVLYDADWDQNPGGSYYAVGADGSYGMIYKLAAAGNTAPARIIADRNAYYSIDWAPPGINADYALLVGAPGSYGNMQIFDGSEPTRVLDTSDTLYDVSWHPDGSYAVAVGEDSVSDGTVYRFSHAMQTTICEDQYLPPGTGSLMGVALKGPSSPSSGIITGLNGAVGFYPSALDQSTRITANAVFPKLYWIGFNDTAMNSRLDQQVSVDTDYWFTLQANYSEGWAGCEVYVQAWHDLGNLFPVSGYPGAPDATTRNLAFTLYWAVGWSDAIVADPAPDLEVTSGAVSDNIAWAHPVDNAQSHHRVEIPVHIGSQIRSATYGGIAPVGPDYDYDPSAALNNVDTWDFNIIVRDMINPSAFNRSFGEFGIQEFSSISVIGNPSGNAPPGTADNPMTGTSQITYSSNAEYYVNVSIPNLYRDGNIASPDWIPATDVSVQNIEPRATAGNSDISTRSYFLGADTPYYIWGRNLVPMQPLSNGTVSNAEYISDFNAALNTANTYTELSWWVTVIAGTTEGIYWGVITVSIEN